MADSLNWTGPAVTERLRAAQIAGVNRTMVACVHHAQENHPWENRSFQLQSHIDVGEYAVPAGDGVRGTWGVKEGVEYALIQELGGTIKHPGGTPYRIGDDGLGVFVSIGSPGSEELPRTKPHDIVLPARPYLRPAADQLYPGLAANIRKAYENPSTSSGGAAQ